MASMLHTASANPNAYATACVSVIQQSYHRPADRDCPQNYARSCASGVGIAGVGGAP